MCVRGSLLAPLVALALAACTANQVGVSPTPVPVVVAQTSKLQLAVGTANIAAQGGQQVTGLNIVATFRQSNGQNATGLNDPVLTAPAGLNLSALGCTSTLTLNAAGASPPVASPQPNQFGGVTIPQLTTALNEGATATIPLPAGLGQFGAGIGVFGYGFGAYNAIPQIDLRSAAEPTGFPTCVNPNIPFTSHVDSRILQGGTGLNSEELALPIGTGAAPGVSVNNTSGTPVLPALMYQQSYGQELPITTYGGPPGWPSPQGYGNFSYFDGYAEGFMDFGIAPVAGTYSLSATYPTSANYAQSATVTATANLSSPGAVLPAMPQPVLTINPDGSGVLNITIPAGLTEAIVNVSNTDCDPVDRPAGPTDHYSIVTKSAGPQVLFLSSNLGPPNASGAATHTFCTVADLQAYDASLTAGGLPTLSSLSFTSYVQVVGFDYPAYESSYPFNTSEAPTIRGSRGTADITTSYPTMTDYMIALPGGSSS